MFGELFERTNKVNEYYKQNLPDWIEDAIQLYLQAVEAHEIENIRGIEDVAVDDVLDFIVSTNPDKEFTDELEAAARKEIEAYGAGRGYPEEEEEKEFSIDDLSDDARQVLNLGYEKLKGFEYDVQETLDFLRKDAVRDLTPQEWGVIQTELTEEAEVYGD